MKWTWESLNPGRTLAPPASITLVDGPRQAESADVVPMAATRPPTTATASASGSAGTPVHTLAFTMSRSATMAGALVRQAAPNPTSASRNSAVLIATSGLGEPQGLYCCAFTRTCLRRRHGTAGCARSALSLEGTNTSPCFCIEGLS